MGLQILRSLRRLRKSPGEIAGLVRGSIKVGMESYRKSVVSGAGKVGIKRSMKLSMHKYLGKHPRTTQKLRAVAAYGQAALAGVVGYKIGQRKKKKN
jgi:hypothetical protein